MAEPQKPTESSPPILYLLLALFALMLTFVLSALIFDTQKSDAAGEGMARGFALVFDIALWAVLGLLVLVSALGGRAALAIAGVAGFAYVLGAPASFCALSLVQKLETGNPYLLALRGVIVALPVLLILLCLAARLPALRAALSPALGACLLGVPTVALAVFPWAVRHPAQALMDQRNHERQLSYARVREQSERRLAELAGLPDSAPLATFLAYFEAGTEDELQFAALRRIHALANAQARIEGGLKQSEPRLFANLWRLEPKVTPALCQGGKAAAHKVIESLKPEGTGVPFGPELHARVEPYVSSVGWLFRQGCDVSAESAEFGRTLSLYADSSERNWLITDLERYRK